MHGSSQALALAAPTARSPSFDPRSLDLTRIGALVSFYHACIGFPVKQTWLDAVRAGNFNSFDGLTYANVAQYCPDSDETILGHLAQQCQNVQSTKPKPPARMIVTTSPQPLKPQSSEVYINVYPISKLYTDDTGRFPVKARSGTIPMVTSSSSRPSRTGATTIVLLPTTLS